MAKPDYSTWLTFQSTRPKTRKQQHDSNTLSSNRGRLVPASDILPAIVNTHPELKPITRVQQKLLDAAVRIREAPDAAERAFMARQLVLCTLPHRNPLGNPPIWTRTNKSGNIALGIQPGFDFRTGKSIGYPYGTIPRLLLFWIITEAVKTKRRRLVLGNSLSEFMRDVGLDPRGGGRRSDQRRLKDQMRRLFKCHIGFQATAFDSSGAIVGERAGDMAVAPKHELWWHPHPEQAALWESWIELGESFYEAVIASPVPVDMRALRALKRSPLALDLYAWASYTAFTIMRKNQPPKFVAWRWLMQQLGADYRTAHDFQKKASAALRKIEGVYPGLTITPADGGFTIHATRLAVAPGD